jgi:hypothetical protein
MFFGITSSPSMYTQGEFGGVTQEMGQHDGQTFSNAGKNKIPVSFARWQNYFIKLIAKVRNNVFWHHKYTQGEFGGITQKLGQDYGQTSTNGGKNHIHMSFSRISKTI